MKENLHVYKVLPRKDHRGIDLNQRCPAARSLGGNVIETREPAGDFKEW
jgi:hypothetical protein